MCGAFTLGASEAADHPVRPPDSVVASFLVYHRFGPEVSEPMTVRTATFRWQLGYLKEHGYPVVPLRSVIAYLRNEGPKPPAGAVVITADDGHRSVFTDMLPLVREYRVPVTLFVYPSAISNAGYAMTWAQLAALRDTGLFDIQSHSYWHPNFRTEKRRLTPPAYHDLVSTQLVKSKTVLEQRLERRVDLLAWPFGLYDDEAIDVARQSGYVAGFTIERRFVTPRDPVMALPRFLISDRDSGRAFEALLPKEALQ